MSEFFNQAFMLDVEDEVYWNSRDLMTVYELVYLQSGYELGCPKTLKNG